MTSKEFVFGIINEMRDALDVMEIQANNGSHFKPEGRVNIMEIVDLAHILRDPSLTQKTSEQTTNSFIYENLRNLKLEDIPDLVQQVGGYEPVKDINENVDMNMPSIIDVNITECIKIFKSTANREYIGSEIMENIISFMVNDDIQLPKKICEIRHLYVDPEERRQGIWLDLMNTLARRYGTDQLYYISNIVYLSDFPETERLNVNYFVKIDEWSGHKFKEVYLFIGNKIGQKAHGMLIEKGFIKAKD